MRTEKGLAEQQGCRAAGGVEGMAATKLPRPLYPRTQYPYRHYVWYLRRHFTANLAIAGGLLLSLPEGKHDARVVQREAKLGRKRV